MNISLWVGRLSLFATAFTTLATVFSSWKPTWAVYAVAIGAAINAFTERVQGGKSKQ